MDVLLRYVHQQPNGAAEFQDAELKVAALTIGSAPDQSVQLLGADVAPRHAIVKGGASGVSIACTRGRRIAVNGERCSSAALREGDVVELGGHRLSVVSAPAGFDLALEVLQDPNVSASDFERAFRTDLDQTWLSKRPAAWILAVLTLLICAVAPLLVVTLRSPDVSEPSPRWTPSDALWSSGPLTPAHQLAAGDRCDVCHQRPFERVQDGACKHCHETAHDHIPSQTLAQTKLGPTERCASCHREHKEPDSYLIARDNHACIECHADSATLFPALHVQPVSAFDAGHHPEFQAHLWKPRAADVSSAPVTWEVRATPLENAREQSNLKFSHAQHLDPSKVLRVGDSEPLACADCHRLSADGEHFEKLTMQERCASCHELSFDPTAPDRQLPHGKPRDVVLMIQDYYTRKYSDPNPPRVRFERRRIPGHEEEVDTCSGPPFVCAMRSAEKEVDEQFARRGCVSCHEVVDTRAEDLLDRYRVSPVRLTTDYFPSSQFSHRAHRVQGKLTGDAACSSCHEAQQSTHSGDLLVPGLGACTQCHSESGRSATSHSVKQVQLQCVSCHAYHPRSNATAMQSDTHE